MAYPLSARPSRQDPNASAVAEFTLRIPGQPGRAARYEGLLIGGGAVVAFVAVWQFVAFRRLVPELFLPGPADIVVAFGAYIAKGQIWNDLWVSAQGLALGFVLAIVVGRPLALAAHAGIGLTLATAGATFRTSKVFVGLVIIAGTGVLITYLFARIEKRFQSWKTNPT